MGMIDKDKVLIGLGQHISGTTSERCGICPYFNGDAEYSISCRDMLLDGLYELLEEQEPRLLTLEEYRARAEMPLDERDPVWEEWRRLDSRWAMPNPGYAFYGTLWRCWTSRPTEAQRLAEAWPALPEA